MATMRLAETHGLLLRPGTTIEAESGALGWRGCFASVQTESPYEAAFAAKPAHLLILHLDGRVEVERWLSGRHEASLIGPGGLFSVPGGRDFRVRLGGALATVHLYLMRATVAAVVDDIGVPVDPADLPPRLGEGDPLIERLMLALRDELLDPGLAGEGYAETLARAVAARLVRTAAGPNGAPAARPHGALAARRRISQALDYIEAHLDGPVPLDRLAALIGLGSSQATALFKEATGTTPHRYLMARRVSRARDLVEHGLPLTEVALACGFAHAEHLARVFKRHVGASPGAYRRGLG